MDSPTAPVPSSVELIVKPRDAALVGSMHVKRILPFRARRMVGPFIFLDEMGPVPVKTDGSIDVPPHPHIGLSTVTYLFEGEMIHRDSLGSEVRIYPGDVNWMTAGRGIAHSERFPRDAKPGSKMHGLQAWVALPYEDEETAPTFHHHDEAALPRFVRDGIDFHLIAGSAYGETSPVKTHSKLFYLSAKIPAGKTLTFQAEKGEEAAMYVVSGSVTIVGDESVRETYAASNLIVFRTGAPIRAVAEGEAFVMLLGGAPLESPRHIYWNFVSSSKERIEKAKEDWRAQRFPKIPGETEFVPLPE